MTSTVLNDRQRLFLEEVPLHHGHVVTYEHLVFHIPHVHEVAKRRFVNQLSRAGWLVPIKIVKAPRHEPMCHLRSVWLVRIGQMGDGFPNSKNGECRQISLSNSACHWVFTRCRVTC